MKPSPSRLLPVVALLLAVLAGPLEAQVEPRLGDLTVTGVNYSGSEVDSFRMYIKGKEMRMDQPDSVSMIIRLEGEYAGMSFIDHDEERVSYLPVDLVQPAERTVDAETRTTYETDPEPLAGMESLSPIPDTVTIVRGDQREVVQIKPKKVGYHYEGDANLPGMDPASLPPNVRDMLTIVLRVDSRAVVDPTLEGADVAAGFYKEMLDSAFASAPNTVASMASGLMAVNREIATAGLPVWTGTRTKVSVDMTGPMAGAMQGMVQGMPGTGPTISVSVIETISTDPVDPALFYDGGMPPDYEIEVIDVGGLAP